MRIKENCPRCHKRAIFEHKKQGDPVDIFGETIHEKIFQCEDCGCYLALVETWADLEQFNLDKMDIEIQNGMGTDEPLTLFCYGCQRVSQYTMPMKDGRAYCPHCGIYARLNEELRERYQIKHGKLHDLDDEKGR